jgi:hypothetical protein
MVQLVTFALRRHKWLQCDTWDRSTLQKMYKICQFNTLFNTILHDKLILVHLFT